MQELSRYSDMSDKGFPEYENMRRKLAAGMAGSATPLVMLAAAFGAGQPAQAAEAVIQVPCSTSVLATAITNASSGATLSLAPECLYWLTGALPAVSRDLTIIGNRATLARSYAPGTPDFTILTVGAAVIISGLNFRHGTGAIATNGEGPLTVNGGVFTGNIASHGGAIDDRSADGVHVDGVTFTGNSATDAGGAIYSGGLHGPVVKDSTFTGNTAPNGGALFDFSYGDTSISGSRFIGNRASSGGAITLDAVSGTTLSHVLISGNYATGDGGGIVGTTLAWNILDSVISGNHSGGNGGGLIDYSFVTASIKNSFITENSADNGGGIYEGSGDLDLVKDIVTRNHAKTNGGGFYSESHVRAARTSILFNVAHGGGGGIYDAGPAREVTLSSVDILGNEPDNCEPPGSIPACAGYSQTWLWPADRPVPINPLTSQLSVRDERGPDHDLVSPELSAIL